MTIFVWRTTATPLLTRGWDAENEHDLRAYVYVQVGMWGFRVEIRQRDCERAKVVFPKGRNVWGRQQPVLWCMDERLVQEIKQACLRAWLTLP